MWVEFDRQSPVGDIRGDIQAAQIVSAVYGSQGVKVSIDEAVIQWAGEVDRNDKQDPFEALEKALLNAI